MFDCRSISQLELFNYMERSATKEIDNDMHCDDIVTDHRTPAQMELFNE